MSEDDYIMILFNFIQLINFVMWSAVQTRVATYAITHIYRYCHNTIILEHETNK